MVERNRKIVKQNLLLIRYSFERVAKSFKRGELQRRWGGKVTIEKTRSKTEVRGKRVRGMAPVVRSGQSPCLPGCCEGDSKPPHAKPAYAAPKISPRACRPRALSPFKKKRGPDNASYRGLIPSPRTYRRLPLTGASIPTSHLPAGMFFAVPGRPIKNTS
jgi:hypothetical protein